MADNKKVITKNSLTDHGSFDKEAKKYVESWLRRWRKHKKSNGKDVETDKVKTDDVKINDVETKGLNGKDVDIKDLDGDVLSNIVDDYEISVDEKKITKILRECRREALKGNTEYMYLGKLSKAEQKLLNDKNIYSGCRHPITHHSSTCTCTIRTITWKRKKTLPRIEYPSSDSSSSDSSSDSSSSDS